MTKFALLREQTEYKEQGLLWNPNSIYHGTPIRAIPSLANSKITIETFRDFLEYLFEKSEHCNHITQGEAWLEFDLYNVNI